MSRRRGTRDGEDDVKSGDAKERRRRSRTETGARGQERTDAESGASATGGPGEPEKGENRDGDPAGRTGRHRPRRTHGRGEGERKEQRAQDRPAATRSTRGDPRHGGRARRGTEGTEGRPGPPGQGEDGARPPRAQGGAAGDPVAPRQSMKSCAPAAKVLKKKDARQLFWLMSTWCSVHKAPGKEKTLAKTKNKARNARETRQKRGASIHLVVWQFWGRAAGAS